MTKLKSIALELLQKYEESETSLIWEYSGDIDKSEEHLDAEVAKYRELIDKYAEQEPTTLQQIIKKHNMANLAYDEMSDFERDILKYAEQEPTYIKLSFPNTFDEFVEQYGITDTDEVYTNGSKLIPAFRVKQWLAEQEPTVRHSCENCKILELLVGFESETICEDDGKDFEYCENNCDFKAPTKECYFHWAEHKRKAVSK